MSKTATIKVYKLRDIQKYSKIEDEIIKKYSYRQIQLKDETISTTGFEVKTFIKGNTEPPDWLNLLEPYIHKHERISDIKRYSMISFLFYSEADSETETETDYCFVITGGAGSSHILTEFDYHFGINILERIFDPDLNKLSSVREKGIIGDILASSRYYRRSRPLAYEDDFAKYFQEINLKLDKSQIKEFFPAIAKFKDKKLKDAITINCSANIEIRIKINFFVLLETILDIVKLLSIDSEKIFNKSLVPLTIRKNKREIESNNLNLINHVASSLKEGNVKDLDYDICPLNFEKFFLSTKYEIFLNNITFSKKKIVKPLINEGSIESLSDLTFLEESYSKLLTSNEYIEATDKDKFLLDSLNRINIVTKDNDSDIQTSGMLLDYIQAEVKGSDGNYFYLDKMWYRLELDFQKTLDKKYPPKVSKFFKDYPFIKTWGNMNETQYNEQYDEKLNPIYLHLIKVDYIELCDVLYYDERIKRLYIIHIKKDMGASIRDLVSQVYMSARIIEEEVLSGSYTKLNKLYSQALENNRIHKHKLEKDEFIDLFKSNREYCLGIFDEGLKKKEMEDGLFSSNIAKFSLIEFSSMMHMNDWEFSINYINKEST